MAKETCKCCGIDMYDDYTYECPVCGNIVCSICFDGEMCDDCRQAANEGHTVDKLQTKDILFLVNKE